MPKRKNADRAPLTATPLNSTSINVPTLQAALDTLPDTKRPRLFPVPKRARAATAASVPITCDLPTLGDGGALDVDLDDLIDPQLLDAASLDIDSLFEQYIDLPSPATPSNLTDVQEDVDEQLVNDYQSMEQHARPYLCKFEQCEKAFARKSDLARHFRIHTNERGCGKSFIQRSALTVHHRVHKPYACGVEDCDRAFARRNSYLKHHQREHPDEPTLPSAHIPRSAPLPPPFTALNHVLRGRKSWSNRSVSAPHGFAASHPSEGAAYLQDGFAEYSIGGNGEYRIAGVGGGVSAKPYRFPAASYDDDTSPKKRNGRGTIAAPASAAPKSLAKGSRSASSMVQREASPHPSLSSDDSDDDDDDEEHGEYVVDQPGTPLLAVPFSATTATFSDSGSPHGLVAGHLSGAALQQGSSDGLGSGQAVEGKQFGVYDGPDVTPKHAVPRQPPVSGLTLDTPLEPLHRLASDPSARSPFTTAPWVGGGFQASQLAIPAGHASGQAYYTPLPATVGNTPSGTALQSPVDQPPRRLTDPDVPSFSFQAPGGQAMMVPVSAIQSTSFPILNSPVEAIVPSQEAPQTAPPTSTRFNSAPIIPTRNTGINVNEWLSTSTGPVQPESTARFPMLPSVSATLSAIADQSPLTSMASEAPGTAPLPPSSVMPGSATLPIHPSPASASSAVPSHGLWGPPIEIPAPIRPSITTPMGPPTYPGPPTPALTSGATVSSVYPQHGLAPLQQSELYTPPQPSYYHAAPANPHAGWTLAPKTHSPLPYYKPYTPQGPYSAHPGLYNGQLSPYTPVPTQPHPSAGYDPSYSQPHTPQHFQYSPVPPRHEQVITLAQPPRGRVDRNVSGMSGIGLGLANVSFGDRNVSTPIHPGGLMTGQLYHPSSQPGSAQTQYSPQPPQPMHSPHVAQPVLRHPLHPMMPPQLQHPPPPRQKHPPVDQEAYGEEEISSGEEEDEYVPTGKRGRKGPKKGKKALKGKGAAAAARAKGRSV